MEVPQIGRIDAAIIAAVIAGVFTFVKEVLTFSLGQLKLHQQLHRKRRLLKTRVAQHHYQLALGADHALQSWDKLRVDAEQSRVVSILPPPPLELLHSYDDVKLLRDCVELASESPRTVSGYARSLHLRDRVKWVADSEEKDYGRAPFYYSFPSTRNRLRELLTHATQELDDNRKLLPGSFLECEYGPRAAYRKATDGFRETLNSQPPVLQEEIEREKRFADAKLLSSSVGESPKPD